MGRKIQPLLLITARSIGGTAKNSRKLWHEGKRGFAPLCVGGAPNSGRVAGHGHGVGYGNEMNRLDKWIG